MAENSIPGNGGAHVTAPEFFSKVLLISGSSVFRDLLKLILTPHSEDVVVACDRKQGAQALVQHNPIDVVISDVELPDGDGFQILDEIAALDDARPEVVLVAEHAVEDEARLAAQKGAVAYLAKPVSFRHIASALRRRDDWVDRRALRRRPGGRVCLLGLEDQIGLPDADLPQVLWYARDLSMTGAFLETESPLPLGSRLDLTIEIGNMRIRLGAEVVRVQQPTWGCGGGLGVHFTSCGDLARDAIHAYVAEGGADTY